MQRLMLALSIVIFGAFVGEPNHAFAQANFFEGKAIRLIVGFTAGGDVQLDVRPIYRKQLSILGTKMGSPRDFAQMVRLVEDQRIVPLVDRVMPLSQANEGYAVVDRGEQFDLIAQFVPAVFE